MTGQPLETAENGASIAAKQELRREAARFVKIIAILLICVVTVRTFCFETWPVQGPSMVPTLAENDRILVFKLPLLLSRLPLLGALDPIAPGDLVVFAAGEGEEQKLIKRVIAEGPRPDGTVRAQSLDGDQVAAYDVRVLYDRGQVYVNNRLLPEDYLAPGQRATAEITEARLRPGELYVLGDHRMVSKDSRVLGPIPRSQVVGEAVLRVWPLSKFGRL